MKLSHLLVLLSTTLSLACSDSSFIGQNKHDSSDATPREKAGNHDTSTEYLGDVEKERKNSYTAQTDPEEIDPESASAATEKEEIDPESASAATEKEEMILACPEEFQDILILDFRSGWWSGGGGGTFFDTILSDMSDPCQDSVKLEYHHFLGRTSFKKVYPNDSNGLSSSFMIPPTQETEFEHDDWNNYSQIWFLSGSEKDDNDVRINSPIFQEILEKAKKSNSNLLVGAGDGFIDHANAVMDSLGLGKDLFETNQNVAFYVYNSFMTDVISKLAVGAELKSHDLFTDVPFIADEVGSASRSSKSDSLKNDSKIEIIGHNTSGKPVIGVTATKSERQIVLDAGLQRFYTIEKDQGKGTLQYLRNIITYLE